MATRSPHPPSSYVPFHHDDALTDADPFRSHFNTDYGHSETITENIVVGPRGGAPPPSTPDHAFLRSPPPSNHGSQYGGSKYRASTAGSYTTSAFSDDGRSGKGSAYSSRFLKRAVKELIGGGGNKEEPTPGVYAQEKKDKLVVRGFLPHYQVLNLPNFPTFYPYSRMVAVGQVA